MSVILVIRHAERPADKNDHTLSPEGQQRAHALPPLFTVPRPDLVRPSWIFASKGNTSSLRMLQTAQPTANALGLPIDTSLDVENAVTSTAKLLVKQAQAGKVVLAVVEHGAIPALLKELAKLLGTTDKVATSHADNDFHTGYLFGDKRYVTFQESVLEGDPGYVKPPPPVVVPSVPPGVEPIPPKPIPPVVSAPPMPEPAPTPVPVTTPDPVPSWPTPAPPATSWFERFLAWLGFK